MNKSFLDVSCITAGASVGKSDYPWTDCKILDKFYEKKVLWAHIECRCFFIGKMLDGRAFFECYKIHFFTVNTYIFCND